MRRTAGPKGRGVRCRASGTVRTRLRVDRDRALSELESLGDRASSLAARLREGVGPFLPDEDRLLISLVGGGTDVRAAAALDRLASSARLLHRSVLRADLRDRTGFRIRTSPKGGDGHLSHEDLALLVAVENLSSARSGVEPAISAGELDLLVLASADRAATLSDAVVSLARMRRASLARDLVMDATDGGRSWLSSDLREWLVSHRQSSRDGLLSAFSERSEALSSSLSEAEGVLSDASDSGHVGALSRLVAHLDELDAARPDQSVVAGAIRPSRGSQWAVDELRRLSAVDRTGRGASSGVDGQVAVELRRALGDSELDLLSTGRPGFARRFGEDAGVICETLMLREGSEVLHAAASALADAEAEARDALEHCVLETPGTPPEVVDPEGLREALSSARARLSEASSALAAARRAAAAPPAADLVEGVIDAGTKARFSSASREFSGWRPDDMEVASAAAAADEMHRILGPNWHRESGLPTRDRPPSFSPADLEHPEAAPIREVARGSAPLTAVATLLHLQGSYGEHYDPHWWQELSSGEEGRHTQPHWWLNGSAEELRHLLRLSSRPDGRRSESSRRIARAISEVETAFEHS